MRRFLIACAALLGLGAPAEAAGPRQAAVLSGNPCAGVVLRTDFIANGGQGIYCLAGQRYPSFVAIPGASFTRASPGTALDSTGHLHTFAAGQPRITDRGLLVEESRTNLFLQSQTLDQSPWFVIAGIKAFGSGSIVDATTAPDGTLTADKLVEDGTNTTHWIGQNLSEKSAVATTYTVSFYAKYAGRQWSAIQANDGSEAATAWFDIRDGLVGTTAANGGYIVVGSAVQALADGWFYCTFTYTTPATESDNPRVLIAPANNNSVYQGDGTSGMYLWGFQKETAPVATSYIATTSVATTRATDVSSISNMPDLSEPLSVYAEIEWMADNSVFRPIIEGGNTAINGISFSNGPSGSSQSPRMIYRSGSGRGDTSASAPTVTAGQLVKMGTASDGTTATFAVNGVLIAAPLTVAESDWSGFLNIGSRLVGSNSADTFIRHIAIYPTVKLLTNITQ